MPEPQLTPNAERVLAARYLRRDERSIVVETPKELFTRVASAVAAAEEKFAGAREAEFWKVAFEESLARLDFLPNSPTLMNAGTALGQLSACFVLPVGDSMEEIFDALKLMALIQQSGGGTGFSFSRLRPRGDFVASTGGSASGPVSFMRVFDAATENIRQGGRRRGANMGVLRVDHPDIEEFVDAKLDGQSFQNFNLSVAVTDAFMKAAAAGLPFDLSNPKSGARVRTIDAVGLMRRISEAAWRAGDPGLIFLDAIGRANPTPEVGQIEATNPCGEVPLLPYEACCLGSLNLAHMTRRAGAGAEVDWERLREAAGLAVRFLDDVVEVCRWPTRQVEVAARANRKIGLGVMGFAEMLIRLNVPYASTRAGAVAEEVMATISEATFVASEMLARERGEFPNWSRSVYARSGTRVRNATRTSIAPTGTISIIAGTSAGIEPLFALAYRRSHVLGDDTLFELNPTFLRHARENGMDVHSLAENLRREGSLDRIDGVPEETRLLFRTALELSPDEHLAVQAAFQRHVDNAVSKTINLPVDCSVEQIESTYRRAWELGLKGITVYRYGSKTRQVLELGSGESPEDHEHFRSCDPDSCRL